MVRLGMIGVSALLPRYRGKTTATSCPCAARALGRASTTSARPPVLENGKPSEATKRILIQSVAQLPPNCTLPKPRRCVKRANPVCPCYNPAGMARQRLGQHFLRPPWREQIARAIRVSPHGTEHSKESNSCWIEIGAGHGEMTEVLAAAGIPVNAVEVDPPLIARLRELGAKFPNLTV